MKGSFTVIIEGRKKTYRFDDASDIRVSDEPEGIVIEFCETEGWTTFTCSELVRFVFE